MNQLRNNPDAFEFKKPVEYKGNFPYNYFLTFAALGLIDYLLVVKTPMDLLTVKTKLIANEYDYIEEVINDLQLIWDNCKLYNQEGGWI